MALQRLLLIAIVATVCNSQEECPATVCPTNDVALLPATNTGATTHYYIGAMTNVREKGDDPYTCGRVKTDGLLYSEAFFWAIKKYAERAGLGNNIPEISVGGFVMDSCSRVEKTIEDAYSFETCRTKYNNVSPRNTVAMFGPYSSAQSLAVAPLLGDMQVTVVSSTATSPELSDHVKYPYYFRTVPSDALQTEVIAKLMQYKAIKYVQVLHQNDAFGNGLYSAFIKTQAVMNKDVCVINHMGMPADNVADVPAFLRLNKQTKVVAVFGTKEFSKRVLQAVEGQSDLKGQFAFFGTLEWGQSTDVIKNLDSAENAVTVTFDTGSFSNQGDVQAFYDYFFLMEPDTRKSNPGPNVNTHNPDFTKYWEQEFNCTFAAGTCDLPNQRLENKIDRLDPYVPYTLMAVDAIIRGVKAAAQKKCSGIHLCSDLLNPTNSRGIELKNNILNATNSNGQRYFSANGDAAAIYGKFKVYQIKNGAYFNVLDYDPNQMSNNGFISTNKPSMVIIPSSCPNTPCVQCGEVTTTQSTTTSTTTKAAGTTQAPLSQQQYMDYIVGHYFDHDQEFTGVWREQPRDDKDWHTRFENGHDWIIALGVCAGLGILCVFVFEAYILYKLMGTKIGKQWRTMWLGQLLLFGIFCAYLVLIAFLFTPSKATCGITRFGVGVSYAMCFGVLLVKLMVLLTSKTSADTLLPGDVDSPNYLRGIYQFLMYIFVVGIQVVIEIQWLIQVPPEAVQVKGNNGNPVWICNHYTWSLNNSWNDMTKFVRTDFENHLISLVYVMFLILLTTIISMKAHGIITNHRESIFIGLASGFTIPVWVAWGLIGGLNRDHEFAQEFGDCSIAFGLFITATIVLFAMFLPKVRQLVNMGVEGIYLEDDRDTYYAGSVVMAPPSYKSRPSSVIYMNSNGYSDPVVIGDQNAVHLRHPGSNYSAPVYVKRGPDSTIGGSGKVLRVTGDLTGKHPRDSKKSMSEAGYQYAGSGYGTYRKSRSESGGTLRRAHSTQDLGAL